MGVGGLGYFGRIDGFLALGGLGRVFCIRRLRSFGAFRYRVGLGIGFGVSGQRIGGVGGIVAVGRGFGGFLWSGVILV